jgi:hypothetical protein
MGGYLLMTIKETKLLSKQELNNYINKQSYKSIEVIESCTKQSLDNLKQEMSGGKITVVVIRK